MNNYIAEKNWGYRVKNLGHQREDEFCEDLGIDPPIKGQDKADAQFRNGQTVSLKRGSRLQLQSTSMTSDKMDIIDVGDLMKMCCLATNQQIDIAPHMMKLCKALQDSSTLASFFRQVMFGSKNGTFVDFIGFKELNFPVWHLFSREDTVNSMTNQLKVFTSQARTYDQQDARKVIIKGSIRQTSDRMVNIIENEVRIRKGKPNFVSIANKQKLVQILQSSIAKPQTIFKDGKIHLIGYGSFSSIGLI
jgi:hypothetical protein